MRQQARPGINRGKHRIRLDGAKKPKYGNRKTTVFGITFDSKREAERYLVLRGMEKRCEIYGLQLQVPFELIPETVVHGEKIRKTVYIADFVYRTPDGETVIEDAKGVLTDVYKLKKKLVALKYGVLIKEV